MTAGTQILNAGASLLEIYSLLGELESHIGSADERGRALLYRTKEQLRLLLISIDRSGAPPTSAR